MRNIIKNTVSKVLALTVVAQLAVPGSALAALRADCTNQTTQGGSLNVCDSRIGQRVDVNNRNRADVENNLDVSANTGMNTINDVNGNVSYVSGDVTANYEVTTDVNHNETTVDLGGDDITVTTENNTTQSDSENIATGTAEVNVDIDNENHLDIENNINVDLATGENSVREVNGDVTGQSGDANSEGKVVNTGNTNMTNVTGAGSIELKATNEKTQSDSTNVANSVAKVNLDVDNENDADVKNDIDFSGYTGGNTLKEVNGDVRSWDSGDVKADVKVENDLNRSETEVDHWADGIEVITSNYITQGDSYNAATGTVLLGLEIENENELDIDNYIDVYGDSGLNEIKEVNGDVNFESGNVDLASELFNDGNVNFTLVDGGGDLVAMAKNEKTQSDSVNEADSFIGLALVVENHNEADIDNDSEVEGYTNYNEAKEVNGDLDFTTGNVDLGNDADTEANFNTTKINDGLDDMTADAANVETQSDSTNIACAQIDRDGGSNHHHYSNHHDDGCGRREAWTDDSVSNYNNLDLDNDLVQVGDTGYNAVLEVNGDTDFNAGSVEESSEATSNGNVNETNL